MHIYNKTNNVYRKSKKLIKPCNPDSMKFLWIWEIFQASRKQCTGTRSPPHESTIYMKAKIRLVRWWLAARERVPNVISSRPSSSPFFPLLPPHPPPSSWVSLLHVYKYDSGNLRARSLCARAYSHTRSSRCTDTYIHVTRWCQRPLSAPIPSTYRAERAAAHTWERRRTSRWQLDERARLSRIVVEELPAWFN